MFTSFHCTDRVRNYTIHIYNFTLYKDVQDRLQNLLIRLSRADSSALKKWMSLFVISGGVRSILLYHTEIDIFFKQTVKTLIRRSIMRRMICVFTVCLCLICGALGLCWLIGYFTCMGVGDMSEGLYVLHFCLIKS